MPSSVFSFYRVDGLSLDALVVVKVLHKEALEATEVVPAITRATTKWINNSQVGKDAWTRSHRGLNMGDLIDYLRNPELRTALAAEGIAQIQHVTSLSVTNGHHLDTILVDQDQLAESIES